ncbi:putative reverse transcriptase domain-containing protein [Tanacetum coccineum]
MAIEGGQGRRNNGNPTRGRAFVMDEEEAHQDPNIMTDTFTLNNHYATTLSDFGADYSFVSTTFIPMLDIEPSNLGFSYGIEITIGQLIEINKVIRGCKLEIEGHTFDIDLIPFGHRSFDVIVGMDWLSMHKAEFVCHEKSAKAEGQKLKHIVVVRNFSEVFPDDLSGLPLSREIEFCIDLILGAMPVAKSPYRLVPSEMDELSSQLRELQDKGFIRPSSSPWGAPILFVKKKDGLVGYYRRFIKNFYKIAKSLTILTRKSKTYDWCEEQERAFQTVKDKLCNSPVLALPDRLEDFMLKIHKKNYTTHDLELGAVVFALKIWRHYLYGMKIVIYTDHKSLQHIFNQKELNMRQHRWIELFNNYDCEIRYILDKILTTQNEASKAVNAPAEMLRGLNERMKRRSDGALYYLDKMYYDLRDMYWWLGMKKDITLCVSKCLTCLKVKAEHKRPSGLLQQPEIPEWKWERIAMDFVTKLPRTSNYKMDRLARLYLNEIIARHDVPISIISDRDGRFMSRFWQSMQEALGTQLDMSTAYHPQTEGQSERTIKTLEDMLRACVLDFGRSWDVHLPLVEFSYNNSYHSSIRCAPFKALYGRKFRSPILWAEVGEGQLIGPEIMQETTEKISQIKDRLKDARDHQKSYVDKRIKPLEFSVGDHVLLKVSPWKGVVHFKRKGKLAPRLPQELNNVHDTFHVSNLKKCLADPTLHVPLEEIQVDAKLNFVEEPVEILERKIKKLKRSRIPIVKTLKDKLCNAPVLALPDGPKDFVEYCDASCEGLGCVLVQRGKISDDTIVRMKSVIYTDHKSLHRIFNQKELNMHQCRWIELFSDYDREICCHPSKANIVSDAPNEQMERRSDGALYYLDQIRVPLTGDVRTMVMYEAHKSKYSVHLGADKIYYDLKDMYWCPGMKKDVALYVSKCLTCSKVKAEHATST